MVKIDAIKLHNGVEMPWLGLGTSASKGDELEKAIKYAIGIGYTSFDTAWFYGNETDIPRGIKGSGAKREDLFIASKLWNHSHGYHNALKAFEESMRLLETDYIDLYLIHWPGKDKYVDTWKALEKLYKEKRVRAIGVSNFLPHHLENLIKDCEIVPMVNQIEANPYFMDYDTIEYCQSRSIIVEAYAPLASPAGYGTSLLEENTLKDIAKKYGKTPAQVSLRFLHQNDIIVIPKTVSVERMVENASIFDFELSDIEMGKIKELNTNKRCSGFDPDTFLCDNPVKSALSVLNKEGKYYV